MKLIDEKALTSVFILDNVLMPLLRQELSQPCNTGTVKESNLRSSLHVTYEKKFVSRVYRLLEQEGKGIRLKDHIPQELQDVLLKLHQHPSNNDGNVNRNNNNDDDTLDAMELVENASLVEQMEKVSKKWGDLVAQCIDSELKQTHRNRGPMSEVDFWRRRHVVLSNLAEQIHSDNVQTILHVLKITGSSAYHPAQDVFAMATKLSVEAGDNAKFLSTLERHLRTLTDGSLPSMITALPALVDGMRMLWTVSRHYNRDERMLPLMERVAYQVALRCQEFVQPHVLLKRDTIGGDIHYAREVIHQSKTLLRSWKDSYMATRERIELMGTSQRRWEFDRVLLFEKTDYMADICQDLLNMIDAIQDFRQLFSKEVLEISGTNEGIDNVSREIDSLVELISTRTDKLDVFDDRQKEQWGEFKKTFANIADDIQVSSASSLENVFAQLRSSEKAYELIVKLKGIKTQPLIQKLIEDRNQDILERYEMELEQAIQVFHKNRESPPLCTRYQKTCGLVSWADHLYLRTKRSIVLFKRFGNLMESPRGQKIKKKYLRFAKEIDRFKAEAFESWCTISKDACDSGLRRPLLSPSTTRSATNTTFKKINNNTPHDGDEKTKEGNGRADTDVKHDNHSPVMIATNFSKDVGNIFIEAEQFDAIGYTIPENVLHLTLQKQIYERYLMELERFVKLHNSTLRTMSDIELVMLKERIREMNQVINKNLNWTSQSIPSFIATGSNAIDTLRSTLDEIRKQSKGLEFIVSQIASASLVQPSSSESADPNILALSTASSSFDEMIATTVDERSAFLANEYKTMSSLVLKVEMATSQTNSGSLSLLKGFYKYWEKRVHRAAVEMCLRSILYLVLNWEKHFESEGRSGASGALSKAPVILERSISSILMSNDKFARWKDQSCHEAIYQNQDGDGSEFFSFRDDVCRDPSLLSLIWGIREGMHVLNSQISEP